MKCEIHGCEVEYGGIDSFGEVYWYCPECEAALDEFDRETDDYDRWYIDANDDDFPDDFYEIPEL